MKRNLYYRRRGRLFLSLLVMASSFIVVEFALRIIMPGLGSDIFKGGIPKESVFIYNSLIGYEIKPFAFVDSHDEKGVLCLEQVNSEGFRGPEYAIPKPKNTFRILALGDSIVQSFTVSYKQTWGQVLENGLNEQAALSNSNTWYEVINAGIGGYVSWQALIQLKERDLKYQPDLVLVLIGANDLVYSSLPNWTPLMDLTCIEQARLKEPTEKLKKSGLWTCIRMPLYCYSYIARLVRQVRNNIYHSWRINNLIKQRQKGSAITFNEKALEVYLKNLEKIYNLIKANGARTGLIIWPTLLQPELLDDTDVHRKLLLLYGSFPLSKRQLWHWNQRYADAQRQFASLHPEIILIDAQAVLAPKNKNERLSLFADFIHLTAEGNRVLGEEILNKLKDAIVNRK